MGSQQSIPKCNFEDIIHSIQNKGNHVLINTMGKNEQECLIKTTVHIHDEAHHINSLLKKNTDVRIIVYGKNVNDESMYLKHNQLVQLGFTNVNVYVGGMFEWLCLQDIYGSSDFPTTKKELDILKFKPNSVLNKQLAIEDA